MSDISAVEYRFLSLAMAYPDEKFLNGLLELKKIANNNIIYFNPLINLAKKEKSAEQQAEYTRLFISGFPKTPCPPYESFFTQGILFGKANEIVRKIYSDWEMDVIPSLADHISTEFEFLAFLSAVKETSDYTNDAKQTFTYFLNNHILNWILDFAYTLQNNTKNNYYLQYAKVLLNTFSPKTNIL